jgi:hypothetical protein
MWRVVFGPYLLGKLGYVLISRLLFGKKGLVFQPNSEYLCVAQDLIELVSPDFEVCGARKAKTAARMRATHACLMPPTDF